MYTENMKVCFEKIPVQLPKQQIIRVKCLSLLHDIGGEWYMKKINQKLPPLKKRKISKKEKEKEDEIKINLRMENQSWDDFKFQIHWNKPE